MPLSGGDARLGGFWVITLADLHSNVEESPEWCSNSRRGSGCLKVTPLVMCEREWGEAAITGRLRQTL
ncbi:hypothetical protein E2C01_002655 [Portunus trituberculatus]|uniref:Uncharacterized protein n=1 Tax=Portunus trituberculatus TaxID=210409 RepID=A0A5B7CKX2_PORTR|nr:hypothetical protein [Portunus trituberculatus]